MQSRTFFLAVSALALAPLTVLAASPRVGGAWTELRKSPLFDSAVQPLPKAWGEALPYGAEFRAEKTYGRWFFGRPQGVNLSGWVYSRMLLPAGDESTLSDVQRQLVLNTGHHSRSAWKAHKLPAAILQHLDFLEGVVLSKKTLAAFQAQDESPEFTDLLPFPASAWAAEPPNLGLTGTTLDFLKEETVQLQKKADAKEKQRLAGLRRKWQVTAVTPEVRARVLGRYILAKEAELPLLTHEEVDVNLYFRATLERALQHCAPAIRKQWQDAAWAVIRGRAPQSRLLPGGYFLLGSEDLELVGNEAELAFLLVRPYVEEARAGRKRPPKGRPGDWKDLPSEAARFLAQKDGAELSETIESDIAASACISRAGYSTDAGLRLLRKRIAAKVDGLDYRVERLKTLLKEGQGSGEVIAAHTINEKRFLKAERLWKQTR